MGKFIRYSEGGQWKYASVKDVGEIDELKIPDQTDLVSAINYLVDRGILELFDGVGSGSGGGNGDGGTGGGGTGEGGTGGDGEGNPNQPPNMGLISQIQDELAKNAITIDNLKQLQGQLNLSYSELARLQKEAEAKAEQMEQDISDTLDKYNKSETDILLLQTQYGDVKKEILSKVDYDTYKGEYDQLIIDTYGKVDSDIGELRQEIEEKVSKAETDIQKNSEFIALKADKTVVDDFGERINKAESELKIQSDKISQTVKQVDYDNAVGVNKWIVSKYNSDLENDVIPTFKDIQGKKYESSIDFNDSLNINAFNEDVKFISHYFTNLYVEEEKVVNYNIAHKEPIAIYLNGAMIFSRKSGYETEFEVSLVLKQGWNRIEMLHHRYNNIGIATVDKLMSSLVDKMTSHIGVGNKDETRLIEAESSIIQTANEIKLKAEQTVVDEIGNQIKDTQAELDIMHDSITSKVSQTEFNNYSKKLTDAESAIRQQADLILQTVTKTEYDVLNKSVTDQASQIEQLSGSIELKADKSVIDGMGKKISDAEASIEVVSDAINLKVDKTVFDETDKKVTDMTSSLTLDENGIYSIASKKELDNVAKTVTEATTAIKQQADSIELKADKSATYTKSDVDVLIENANTAIQQTAESIKLKANSSEIYNKLETDDKLGLKADNQVVESLTERVVTNESSLEVLSKSITSKVSQTDFDNVSGKVSGMETTVNQTAEALTSKANKTDVDKVTGDLSTRMSTVEQNSEQVQTTVTSMSTTVDGFDSRLSSAESTVTQTANAVSSKVEKDGVISAINQTAESVQINASKINLVGYVTASHIKSLYGLNVNNQFIVDSYGNVTFGGNLSGATGTFSGSLSAATGTFSGRLSAATGSFSGDISAAYGTFRGDINVSSDVYVGRAIKLDQGNRSSYTMKSIQFNGTDSWIFTDADSLVLNSIGNIVLETNDVILNSPEYGYCGVGGMNAAADSYGTTTGGVGVGFKFTRKYTPSSVSLIQYASNNIQSVNTTQITNQGFWMYINSNLRNTFGYWRGHYFVQ